ncbi:cell surface protein [Diaphorobacter nitroreducens]|uniref:cell surface protein n=1 Tax=Diaphorobacter nitroreducens TaxID=164759 RepID=UPI0028992CBC|nr:cell surface protein [Diaphorobacter nitroreducens]
MKRNVLALSIAAMIGGLGFVGSASAALTVNESGEGHMLLVPYYTAQNGNMTVLHVVNTDTVNGKAMKVRFRGASNSDDVLDFQVFMSPGDVWTAAVTAGADGVAQLVTADGTCTLPHIAKDQQIPFVTDRLPASMDADAKAAQTREGYVEIFNMADIDGATGYGTGGASKSALYTAIKHVNGVAPCTDAALNATLNIEDVADAPAAGLIAPTSGLTGSWYIINVPETTTFAGAMTAIVSDATPNNIVFSPQKNGAGVLASADPLFNASVLEKQFYDVPDLSTPYSGATATVTDAAAQANSLTQALAATTILNQYANDPTITAKTDWVFSMPTRRYSVAANYANPVSQQYATVAGTTVTPSGTAPYRYINNDITGAFFTATNTSVNTAGQICVTATGQTFYDREEISKTSGAVFSPGQISKTQLCGEVSVLSFADSANSVLAASVARSNVTGAYVNGWGSVNFAAPGVPVIGASFIKLSNPNANNGTSGTYGITWPHAKK